MVFATGWIALGISDKATNRQQPEPEVAPVLAQGPIHEEFALRLPLHGDFEQVHFPVAGHTPGLLPTATEPA
jgi:hypothetical protein